jgi:hypothetical protein
VVLKLQRLLQLRSDDKLCARFVVFNVENVRLATDLAIFDVTLATSCGLVDRGRIPFSARRALKPCFHWIREYRRTPRVTP